MKMNLDKIKLFLAVSLLLFSLFNCGFSYGFMLVEQMLDYLNLFPPMLRFSTSYNVYFDMVVRYSIVSGCYFLYILFLRKEKTILNQAFGLLLLFVVLYQTGVYSFIVGRVLIPGQDLQWTKIVFSTTFMYITNFLQILFWGLGIVLTTLQLVTVGKCINQKQRLPLN